MGQIIINGKVITSAIGPNASIVVKNNVIMVDGKPVDCADNGNFKESVAIVITSDSHIVSVETDGDATINGNVGKVSAGNNCQITGNVSGSANAGNNLKVSGSIGKSANAGNNIIKGN